MKYSFIVLLCVLCFSQQVQAFQYFKSKSDVEKHFNQIAPKYLGHLEGDLKVLELATQKSKMIEELVKILSDVYKNKFNLDFDGYPHVIFFNSGTPFAAAQNPVNKPNPFYLTFSSSFVDTTNDQEKRGIVAHELAHLFLQSQRLHDKTPERKYYQEKGEILFSELITHNKSAQSDVEFIKALSWFSGEYLESNLGGFPININSHPLNLENHLRFVLQSSPENKICDESIKLYQELIDNIYADEFLTIHRNIKNKNNLVKLVSFEESFSKCSKDLKASFLELHLAVHQIEATEGELQSAFTSSLSPEALITVRTIINKFNQQKSGVGVAILESVKLARKLAKDRDPEKKLRVYTHEDHADEVAIQVLNKLGWSSIGLNTFITRGQSCGEPISYGSLFNDHHNPCWRAKRNSLYEERIRAK